jgi:hypothetical protein
MSTYPIAKILCPPGFLRTTTVMVAIGRPSPEPRSRLWPARITGPVCGSRRRAVSTPSPRMLPRSGICSPTRAASPRRNTGRPALGATR